MSGSDANETQIKIVWYYNNVKGRPNKKKIISRQRGYHGSGIVTGSLTGLPSFHQHFDLPIDRVKHTVCPHWYRQAPAGMSDAQFVDYCVEELEKLIAKEGADTIAAFIGEPVMGTGGILPPPAGYGLSDGRVIDGSRGGNSARFLNHACAPNCEAIETGDRVFIHALTGIRPGEELFIDYSLAIDGEMTEDIRVQYACHCGDPVCRGSMLGSALTAT